LLVFMLADASALVAAVADAADGKVATAAAAATPAASAPTASVVAVPRFCERAPVFKIVSSSDE
jgi:hypothetical protein